jgi:hypothetical protein
LVWLKLNFGARWKVCRIAFFCSQSSSLIFRVPTLVVHTDGSSGQSFICKFPFSFYIARILQGMRQVVEPRTGQIETILTQQFAQLGFEYGLSSTNLPEGLLKRYTHDIAAMHVMYSTKIDREIYGTLLWHILCLYKGGQAPTCLAQIHARLWQCERTVHRYCLLLDAVPSIAESSLVLLEKRAKAGASLGGATDLAMVRLVLDGLMIQNQSWAQQLSNSSSSSSSDSKNQKDTASAAASSDYAKVRLLIFMFV